jgi:glycosyltransferase involved in cell wall biosynthesis
VTRVVRQPPIFSVVVPAFNEEDVLGDFHARLSRVLQDTRATWEVIYVDDGSQDRTRPLLQDLQLIDPHVTVISLSRNFGKEAAITAGLDHADGEAVIVIDCDLQDPPEVIPELIAVWRRGADMVYATRRQREGDTWMKKTTARLFYRLAGRLSDVAVPADTGDFRLMSQRVVEALRQLPERSRFMKGLFTWVGFATERVYYDRTVRHAGVSKWNYWKLWNFALEGLISFTVMPLKVATYLGLLIAVLAGIYLTEIIIKTLIYSNPVSGYPSLMVVVLFLGGAQLISLGVIGEYLSRIFTETKRRPIYLIDRYTPARLVAATQTADKLGSEHRLGAEG